MQLYDESCMIRELVGGWEGAAASSVVVVVHGTTGSEGPDADHKKRTKDGHAHVLR